ncbi:hypothetical protein CCR75_005357 [Bremia lactucae]|uniref:Uncharacterized protein n=1 Tax=Bremia lactucae TaxID=4779 RepID=A0A976FIV2_BRELC|nr:hypothetical protein CCR75_005357 [Bremia lactucae]
MLGARKGPSKKLKGNSRICILCFNQIWQEIAATSSLDVSSLSCGAKHVSLSDITKLGIESRFMNRESMIEPGLRRSVVGSMMKSIRRSTVTRLNRRRSMLEKERRDFTTDQFSAHYIIDRHSYMDKLEVNSINRPVAHKDCHGGLSYQLASFLGLVAGNGADRKSMKSAIGLWTSLFAASILLVIALADDFSLYQRLFCCVATYGVFLMLHPWIHRELPDK